MSGVVLQKLSTVESRDVEWLWKGYIPLAMLSIVEGDPDIGKSYCLMDIAARITIGGELPDGTKLRRANVVILSAEDDPSFTIRPRIEALGGDVRRVYFSKTPFTFTDECIEQTDELFADFTPKFVFVDTLYSFMPDDVDMSKPAAVRQRLHAIDALARKHGCAVVLVRHWTKGDRGKAIYRGGGLIDIVGVVRAGVTIAVHPEDPAQRVFAQMKHNLSRPMPSWIFEILEVKGKDRPIVEWRGTSDITADRLEAAGNAAPKALAVALEFLKEQLCDGPRLAKLIREAANSRDIAKRTIDRAKKDLGVVSTKSEKGWLWALAEESKSE